MERTRALQPHPSNFSSLGGFTILSHGEIYLFGPRLKCKNTVASALRMLRSSYCG